MAAKWTPRLDALVEGSRQLGIFALRRLPLVVLAALAFARFDCPRSDTTWKATIGVTIGLFAALMLLAGGDWMGVDRLPLPVLPLLALLAALGVAGAGPRFGAAVPAAAALTIALTWLSSDAIPPHGHSAREVGEWLRRTEPDSSQVGTRGATLLGVAAAGAVPFYSGLATVDALGITDPVVARTPPSPEAAWRPGHMRYDIDRFLEADPDVIVWEFGRAWCEARLREPARQPEHRGDFRRELLRSPLFRERYQTVPGAPPGSERFFTVFQRRNRARSPAG